MDMMTGPTAQGKEGEKQIYMSNNIFQLKPKYSKQLFLKLHIVISSVSTTGKSTKWQEWMSGITSAGLKATLSFPFEVGAERSHLAFVLAESAVGLHKLLN